jgi:TRAP-type C4-dicarboxylate transport system substrate-binding protein
MSTGKEKNSLMFALWAMSNQNGIYRMERNYKINSKIYEKLRKEIPILLKETNKGRKYTNRKSPTYTNEQKEKMKERMIELNKKRAGRKITEETKQKLRIAALKQKKIFGRNHTEETKEKIKNARAKQTNVKNQYTKNQSSPK